VADPAAGDEHEPPPAARWVEGVGYLTGEAEPD
jgi:hypothetical protein